ncbi:YfhO family protein [Rhizomonospora bruguierae]|uniref:YfhO family protein n=1 Tax=Rhizomonospora bruguierae TaxID=1581705 RepID=UPI001BCB0E07|nr:YfhO family protein [Micromonospora sp. NBRC 107566]
MAVQKAAAESPSAEGAVRTPDRRAGRPERVLSLLVGLLILAFALVGIGSPLLGQTVFAGTDQLVSRAPYNEMPQFAQVRAQNTFIDDTWDTAIPHTLLFADELRRGHVAAWNPYVAGGAPLGATPNYALASPVTAVFYLLPGWLAPGVMKLAEILVAVGGAYLFLRRLRLRRSAALLGGLVFASSAFLVVWTNWPQTRVAAFIPAVFWALELIVQRRRAAGLVALALALAAMIFGGFPAVTGYTLATAGPYLLVRTLAEHRRRWRPVLADLFAAAGGILAGVLLTAFQLIPWFQFMSHSYVRDRGQTPEQHLSIATLVTTVAPWALGSTDPGRPPYWYRSVNMIESLSYLGAAALVLVLAALLLARRGRAALPPGAWGVLVAAVAGWFTLIYLGGPPLAAAQRLPLLFASNFVGRGRSVLGFLLAVLAAVGLELLLRRRAAGAGKSRRWDLAWGGFVLFAMVGFSAWSLWSARHGAITMGPAGGRSSRLDRLAVQLGWGVLLLVLALAAAAVLWRADRRRLRLVGAGALAVLVAGQALSLVIPFYPRAPKDTFYPLSGVHQYLKEHLGQERYAGSFISVAMSIETANRIRSASGHTFVDVRYGELVRDVPGAERLYPTYVVFDQKAASSPVLDRISARYFVAQSDTGVAGDATDPRGDGSTVTLRPETPVEAPLPGTGRARAVLVTPTSSARWGTQDRIEVVVRDDAGREVARAERRVLDTAAGTPFSIPVAADSVPDGTPLTATVILHAARELTVRGSAGAPALGMVHGRAEDGLRLVSTADGVVYERLHALPRLRWASQAVVEPDPARRLALLAAGTLQPDQVLLDAPAGTAAAGGTATITPITDGTDEMSARVDARGGGYLVLADTLQHGWRATVDGAPATLHNADHAFVAVSVPAGQHTVRFEYVGTDGRLGLYVTIVTGLALIAVAGVAAVHRRRRQAGPDRPGAEGRLSSAGPGGDPDEGLW